MTRPPMSRSAADAPAAALPAGKARDALRSAVAALDNAEARAQPHEVAQALAGVARVYADLLAFPAAASMLERSLRWARHGGAIDLAVDLQCELCELLVRQAAAQDTDDPGSGRRARDSARDQAFEASTKAHLVSDPQWEVTVLLRISDALNRCGDHDDAAALQVRALLLMAGDTVADQRLDAAVAGALRQ